MRLPASVTTQPPEPINAPQPAATYVDPTEVADVPQAQVEHKPWWVRASSAIVNGAFTNVAAAFIAVTGAIYVGMAHAPWVRSLAGHTPTAEQASDAMSVAMAATPASAAWCCAGSQHVTAELVKKLLFLKVDFFAKKEKDFFCFCNRFFLL